MRRAVNMRLRAFQPARRVSRCAPTCSWSSRLRAPTAQERSSSQTASRRDARTDASGRAGRLAARHQALNLHVPVDQAPGPAGNRAGRPDDPVPYSIRDRRDIVAEALTPHPGGRRINAIVRSGHPRAPDLSLISWRASR
jgi:hypothetical protein